MTLPPADPASEVTATATARTPDVDRRVAAAAAAARAVPGVAGLTAGRLGTVATWVPGTRIEGVRLRPDGVLDIALVAEWGINLPDLAAAVAAAVAAAADLSTAITIVDIRTPPRPVAEPAEETLP